MSVSESVVQGFAHCRNARCDGYVQEPVDAVKTIVERMFVAEGPLGGFAENSHEYVSFADNEQMPCPVCGHDREVTVQERPSYNALSGFPQDGLLGAAKFNASKVPDTRSDELEARLEAQQAQISRLLEKLEEKS